MIAKSTTIKGRGGKSGGRAAKAVGLTSGGLRCVWQWDWGRREATWPRRRSQPRA